MEPGLRTPLPCGSKWHVLRNSGPPNCVSIRSVSIQLRRAHSKYEIVRFASGHSRTPVSVLNRERNPGEGHDSAGVQRKEVTQLWTKTIFRHWYFPIPFGPTECMSYEYVTSIALESSVLILTSARGREYQLDTHTRKLRQTKAKRPNPPAAPNPARAS